MVKYINNSGSNINYFNVKIDSYKKEQKRLSMNINTSTLLGMLAPKLTNVAKQSIEKASVDGKVNLGEVIKDQSVRSVLNNLLKDVASGVKTKENVLNLLENSKHTLSFKNFSSDIKLLAKAVETSPTLQNNPKLMNQVSMLKSSMIDLSKVDSKTLMNSLSNSGVFLESKLLQQSIPIEKIISQATQMLSKSLEHYNPTKLTTLPKQINAQIDLLMNNPTISKDLKLEVKLAVSNLLTEFTKGVNLPTNSNLGEIQTNSKVPLENLVNLLNKNLPNSEVKTQLLGNLQSLFTNLTNLSVNEKATLLTSINQQSTTLVNTTTTSIPKDIQMEIKSAIANLLRPIQTPATLVQSFQSNMSNIQQQVLQQIPNTLSGTTMPPLLQELGSTFKESFILKENLPVLRNIFLTLVQKVDVTTIDEQVKTGLKTELQNLSLGVKTLESAVTPEQKAQTLQNVFENLKTFSNRLETTLAKLAPNQMESIPKNLANDLKGIVMQISEQIETSKEPVAKEIRAMVDKISSQVEFFQLLSYTSNSNHSALAFLQDNIEDSDIKFHKTDQDTYSCQINLSLKDQGDLKVLLVLDKFQNLGVNIGVEDNEFKQKVQDNLPALRGNINSIGLLLQALNVFDINSEQIDRSKQVKGYGDSSNISFGLDLTV